MNPEETFVRCPNCTRLTFDGKSCVWCGKDTGGDSCAVACS